MTRQATFDFDAPPTCRETERSERTIQERFEAWLATPEGAGVYREFLAIARQLRAAGHEHYGAKSIMEVLRFHRSVRGPANDAFKIDNNWSSRLARVAMSREPNLIGFFTTRELRS